MFPHRDGCGRVRAAHRLRQCRQPAAARSTARAREIAVRIAMGATRWRVVRQLLLESLVLSLIGGSIGLLLAVVGVRSFASRDAESGLPYWVVFDVDYVVFGYVAAICLLTAVLFGLAPALLVSATSGSVVLKEGGEAAREPPRAPLQCRDGPDRVDADQSCCWRAPGHDPELPDALRSRPRHRADDLMTMRLRLPDAKYTDGGRSPHVFRSAGIPAGGHSRRRSRGGHDRCAGAGRRRAAARDRRPSANARLAAPVRLHRDLTPRFFDGSACRCARAASFRAGTARRAPRPSSSTSGWPSSFSLVRSRSADDSASRRGDRSSGPSDRAWRTIVGVVPTIKHGSPQDVYENAVVYIPYRQETPGTASLLIRSPLARPVPDGHRAPGSAGD